MATPEQIELARIEKKLAKRGVKKAKQRYRKATKAFQALEREKQKS